MFPVVKYQRKLWWVILIIGVVVRHSNFRWLGLKVSRKKRIFHRFSRKTDIICYRDSQVETETGLADAGTDGCDEGCLMVDWTLKKKGNSVCKNDLWNLFKKVESWKIFEIKSVKTWKTIVGNVEELKLFYLSILLKMPPGLAHIQSWK